MTTLRSLFTWVLLSVGSVAEAGDLALSGAISGAGQGLSNAASQMMTLYGASMLQQQAAEAQRARDEQQMRWQMEREERAMAHQREMMERERNFHAARQQQQAIATPAYMAWLKTKPALYQEAIRDSTDPQTIEDSRKLFEFEERLRQWREDK